MLSLTRIFTSPGFAFAAGLVVGVLLTVAWFKGRGEGQRRWRQVIARLEPGLARFRSGVEARWRAETAVYAQQFHLGREWASLSQVVVPPRFLAPAEETEPDRLPEWGATQLNYLWPDLAARVATPPPPEMTLRQLLGNGRRVVIAAEPGAGKTTLLAYITWLCATTTADSAYSFLQPFLPALVHLAELDLGAAPPTADPLSPLIQTLQKRSHPLNRGGLHDRLRQKARSGHILLLLDGWGETTLSQREQTLAWLRRLLAAHDAIRIFIVTPFTNYGALLKLGFTWTVLRPWRLGDVEQLTAAWAKILANNPLPPSRFWRPGESPGESLLRFWLVAYGRETGMAEPPRRRFDLQQKSLAFFLPESGADSQLMLAYWQRLAYALLREGKLSLTAAELEALATEFTVTEARPQLLRSLTHSPLFVTDASGGSRFLSVVWRDYLAAQYLAQHNLIEVVTAHAGEPYWQSVLYFYAAQATVAGLAQTILRSQTTGPMRDGLFQVASWMAESREPGEWRSQVLVMLGQLTRQRTFAQVLRQRAAVALAQTEEPGTLAFVRQLLERSDPFLRQAGVVALSHLGVTEPAVAVELLTKLVADGDGRVRETAVSALAWLATPLAEKQLLSALIQGDATVSQAAAVGLALNGREGMEILREALEDDSPPVRRAAVYGLAQVDEPWVEPTLVRLERSDAAWVVRTAATEALELMRSRAKATAWQPPLPRKMRWLAEYAAQKGRVVPDGPAALPFLAQALAESAHPSVRATAALTLGLLPDENSIPAVETAFRDSDMQVQEAAFATLCLIQRAYGL